MRFNWMLLVIASAIIIGAGLFVIVDDSDESEAAVYTGKCGDNLTWSYDESTKTLTITGTGEMYDYAYNSLEPWKSYKSSMETLSLPNGLTHIGNSAFSDCYRFTGNLTIPNSVTSIGNSAFSDCYRFTGNLTIPNSVTSIGNSAFSDCYRFTGSLTIPNSVTSIGNSAFSDCYRFTGSLTIPSSVKSIGTNAFSGCYGFTENLTIPSSVTNIGDSAFRSCSGFTGSLTIPSSVKNIGNSAFEDCEGFTSITIQKGVETISDNAFFGCSGFTGDLTIPNSVTSIGDSAFRSCSGFTGSLTISGSVKSIGTNAFTYCKGFTGNLIINNGIETIGNNAFGNCFKFTGSLTIPGSVKSIGNNAFEYCKGFTGNLIINNGIETIGSYAFYACSGFTGSLTIPSSVKNIGNSAFEDCEGFTGNLVIEGSIITINNRIFCSCSGFTGDLTIPSSVTSIGSYAFFGCSGFTGDLTIPSSVTSIGSYAFYGCSGFTGDLVIPKSVTGISGYAFYRCSGFTGDLTILASITYIYESVFKNCSGFTGKLTMPNTIKTIDDNAFENCSGFTGKLTIPDGVTRIGGSTFQNCTGFTSISIPSSVAGFGGAVFYGISFYAEDETTRLTPNVNDFAGRSFTGTYERMIRDAAPLSPQYTVTVVASPSAGGTVTGGGTYSSGTTTTITATANSGYQFVKWNDNNTNKTRTITVSSDATYTATFVKLYTLTVISAPSAGGTVTGGGTYVSGTTTTITATANSGYQFVKWNDNNTNASRSITVNSNITYTATFVKLCTVTVTASPSSGGTVTGGGTYSSGSTINISATANSGYQFVKWNDNTTNASRSVTVSSNITYTATFAKLYTITVVASPSAGGTVTGGGTYTSGNTTTITATANSGYQFVKWNDNNTNASRSVVVTSNITYTATFAKLYTLTVVASTGGTVTGGGTYASGSTVNISANANNGYQFVKWNDNNTNASRSVTVNSDVTYTATFKDVTGKTVTLIASPAEGGTVSGGGTYVPDSSAILTATPNAGYRFVKWNDNNTNATRTIVVTSNITYTATFEQIQYKVTVVASPAEGGTVTGGGTYDFGSSVTISATANNGYQFVKRNDNNTTASRSVTVNSDITYTATFVRMYNVNVVASPSSGGTVTGGGTYSSGSAINISATANSGYQFVKWNDDNTNASRPITVNSDVTYTATFVKLYTLTVIASAGGTVTGGGTYASGSTVNISANANSGYQFVKWNDNNTNASRSITVNSDVTYTATFKDVSGKTVTLIASPAEGGTVSGGGTYVPDSSATLIATPNTGYEFVKWNDNNTNATRTIVVTSDVTYTATFELLPVCRITSSAVNGTITETQNVDEGEDFTVSYRADDGYSLKYIIVDGTNVNISYYPNSYTFYDVSESHTISVVYGTEEEYTVQFRDWNGSLISSAQYSKNESIIVPESPSRDSDDDYSYKFSKWSPSVPDKCISDAIYIAQYDRTAIDNDNDDSDDVLIIALAVAVVVFAALVAVAVFVMRKN